MHRSKQRVRVVELPPYRRQWNHACFYLGSVDPAPRGSKPLTSPCHQRRLGVNWGCLSLDPITRYFHTAPDTLGCDRKVSLTSEFVRDKLPNYARPIARFTWSCDGRSPDFLPFDDQPLSCSPVRWPVPPNRYPAFGRGKRAIFCGVGSQLMEHECHRLTGFRAQQHLRSIDLSIVTSGVRRQLALEQFRQWYPLPSPAAQELVR